MTSLLVRLILICACVWSVSSYAADKTKDTDKKPESDASSLKDEPQVQQVVIPVWLRDDGYTLLVDGKNVDLTAKEVTVTPSLDPVYIELYDANGRLVKFNREYYGVDTFES